MTAQSKLRGQKGNSASAFCPFAPVESFLVAKVSWQGRRSGARRCTTAGWPTPRWRRLAGIDHNAALGDDMAEEADGGAGELALRRLGVELVVPQSLEHHAHVHEVLLARLGEGEDVIAEDLNEAGGQSY